MPVSSLFCFSESPSQLGALSCNPSVSPLVVISEMNTACWLREGFSPTLLNRLKEWQGQSDLATCVPWSSGWRRRGQSKGSAPRTSRTPVASSHSACHSVLFSVSLVCLWMAAPWVRALPHPCEGATQGKLCQVHSAHRPGWRSWVASRHRDGPVVATSLGLAGDTKGRPLSLFPDS